MEFLYIAGGALLIPLFIAVAAIGLVVTSVAIEFGELTTKTVTLRSFPAAWASRRHKRQTVKAASASSANRWSRLRFLTAPAIEYWTWWLSLAAAGLAVVILAIPMMNILLFEHCLRLALRGIEQSHGIVVTYHSAEGNWLKGRAELRGARALRRGHVLSDFDLTVDRLNMEADTRKIISGQLAFESVMASGVRGRYTQAGKRGPSQSALHYTISRLRIDDAEWEYVDRSRQPQPMRVPLKLTSMKIDDYRSRWALFDVLFRSDARGTVYGRPFAITSRATPEAHESVFKVTELPLSLLGQRIRAPLGGQVDGVVDADIRTQWHPDDESTQLNMHCRLLAHRFIVHMPNGLFQRAARPTIAARTPRHMPLEFDLVMNQRAFDGQTSLLASGILESIGEEANRHRRQAPPRSSGRIDNVFRRFGAGVRSLVNPRGR